MQNADNIGAKKTYQNPNDPALTGGTYKDPPATQSPARYLTDVFPMESRPKPYKG